MRTRIPMRGARSTGNQGGLGGMQALQSPDSGLDILALGTHAGGWGPIAQMARLAARTLDARLAETDGPRLNRAHQVRGLLPVPRKGNRHLLIIAPLPGSLAGLLTLDRTLLRRYRSISAWVIDSFWHERIPHLARRRGWIDHVYVMDPDDREPWAAAVAAGVSVLPWGADTLAASNGRSSPSIDLQRVGRQPPAWDDDTVTARVAAQRGVRFAGRPAFGENECASQKSLHRALRSARAVLAFSNLLSPADYTHPTREYLTGRWTDALAHGCMLVGQVPRCSAAQRLVPDWATVTLPADDPDAGLDMVAEDMQSWTGERADRIRSHARDHLDWRHRFAQICADLELSAPVLDHELGQLGRHSSSGLHR